MNQSGMEINVAANGRILSLNQNPAITRTSQTRAISRPRYRKDCVECSDPSTEERRYTYKPGNDSSEPIVSMVYNQEVQLVYNNNGPSYKESLTNYVKDAGHQAEQAAENNFQEYARCEKAQSMPFHWTPYTSSDTTSFFPQFGSCSSNPSFSRDAAAGSAARDMHFSPTTAAVSTITSGKPFPSAGTNEKLGFDLNEEPSCELETDELLRTFSQVGMAEFSKRNKNISTITASQIVEPNRSFSPFLNGEKDCAMVTAIPSYTIASPMSQLGQYGRWEPAKRMSIYDILFLQSQPGNSENPERKGEAGPKPNPYLVPNASSSGYLSFSEHSSSDPKSSKQKGLAVSEPSGHLAPTGSSSGNHGFSPHVCTSSTFEPTTLNLFK
ncbi:uncharacterized protein LOC120110183 [Phoenix dactylifera]|uniref:Uncharacterized protein LOC120110183 n=1 Tax=Phoenix dactylifera TaxID=42345 RepID=A0A8B9A1C7_PHODC|nr:uncharacterized protein LOC120110183 [Phoenix dactylifera]XP_038980396.1 uncharacterized protein LOC120110183 [Phoenix dactylifera]XP_038980397.1 uncharacterized protein LOC120110183 [Phoenix dactylifera]